VFPRRDGSPGIAAEGVPLGNLRRLLSISRRYSPGIQSSRHQRKNTAGFVAFLFRFFLRATPKEIAALLLGIKW